MVEGGGGLDGIVLDEECDEEGKEGGEPVDKESDDVVEG